MTPLLRKYSNLNIKNLLKYKTRFETVIFLLTIVLAGFLGNYVALLATGQIADMLTRFIVGIFLGLLVGIGVGIISKRTWEKVQSYFLKMQSQ
jgi:uncharacterized membrane protein YjjP (DUF1212 family)